MNAKTLLSSSALALALTACGPDAPKQYLINWDNQTTVAVSRSNARCDQADTANQTDITTTDVKSSMIVTVYQGDDSKAAKPYYADFGKRTLAGTKGSDGTYNLSDAQVTHNTTDPNAVIDDSDTVTVTMKEDSSFISGEWDEELYHSDPHTTTGCKYSTKFRGQSVQSGSNNATLPTPGENH
jgi:hypothetical protein